MQILKIIYYLGGIFMVNYTERIKHAKVEIINGVPTLTVDGRPINLMTYQFSLGREISEDPNKDTAYMLRNFGEAGIELYFIRINLDGPDDLEKFKNTLHENVRVLRENVPNALAIIWMTIRPYEGFVKKYPGDIVMFDDGSTGGWTWYTAMGLKDGDVPRHTHASEAWRYEVGGMLREIVYEVNNTELADTIIGYFFFPLSYESSYFADYDRKKKSSDYSQAMQHAFRNYLIYKYNGSEEKLRKAWKDDSVTFETAKLPTKTQKETPDYGYFWDPELSQQVYDYAECRCEVWAETLMFFAQVCKRESNYRAVTGAFWGYLQNQDVLWGGQSRYKHVMDCPYLDFWASPYTYENKGPGQFASMRYTVKSLQKHGKLWFAEADTFISDSSLNSHIHHGFPMTTKEQDRELLKRDFIYPLCESTQAWWIDWSSGISQYEEDGFKPLMRRMQEIGRASLSMPRGSVSDIAAIVDQESLLTTPNNIESIAWSNECHMIPEEMFRSQLMNNAIDRFRVHELPFIGTPVDFYETDDAISESGRKYKMYIFLNNYWMDDGERERINKNLKKDGNVLVWMYGAGLINPDAGEKISVNNVSSVTGINMGVEMVEQRSRIKVVDGAKNILAGLIDGDEIGDFEKIINCGFTVSKDNYGSSHKATPCTINPVIYIDDPDADILGTYVVGSQPGFAIKEFDNWTSVYIGSPAVQSYVLRAIAKKAGVHLFVDDADIIVYANESFVGLHTVTDGNYTINLKDKYDVFEAFDERIVSKHTKQFEEYIPKETSRLYCLRPEK